MGGHGSLHFEHHPPAREDSCSFVFVNALTGTTAAWEGVVAPSLRREGFGTLSYNFRGQEKSTFDPGSMLTPDAIVDDFCCLLAEVKPARPVLVGLSIGGLFAAQAVLRGVDAKGLVLLNTLREIGPRLAWINDAMPHIVGVGGVGLLMDMMLPLLVNEEFSQKARIGALAGTYQPLDPAHGHMNLMKHASRADWDVPYEKLELPVLVISGLQDRVFYDVAIIRRLANRMPDVRCEDWPDAGHLIPLERPEKLARRLSAFVHELH